MPKAYRTSRKSLTRWCRSPSDRASTPSARDFQEVNRPFVLIDSGSEASSLSFSNSVMARAGLMANDHRPRTPTSSAKRIHVCSREPTEPSVPRSLPSAAVRGHPARGIRLSELVRVGRVAGGGASGPVGSGWLVWGAFHRSVWHGHGARQRGCQCALGAVTVSVWSGVGEVAG